MLPLGFCIIFCTRSSASFQRAREERLKVSGEPKQYDNLKVFVDEQVEFRKVISRSRLPHLEVDVSDDDVELAGETIADWLQENDLLGVP